MEDFLYQSPQSPQGGTEDREEVHRQRKDDRGRPESDPHQPDSQMDRRLREAAERHTELFPPSSDFQPAHERAGVPHPTRIGGRTLLPRRALRQHAHHERCLRLFWSGDGSQGHRFIVHHLLLRLARAVHRSLHL